MPEPIACQLPGDEARAQVQAWRDLFIRVDAAWQRPSATVALVRLHPDLVGLEAIVRLAQREKACCPFFDFALGIEATHVDLRITVPSEAVPILDSLAPVIP